MKTKYATRKIARREYETECDWCGCPLEVGDTAYDVEEHLENDDGPEPWTLGTYCSAHCRTCSEESTR